MFNFLWHKISLTVRVPFLLTRAFHGSRKEITRGPSCLMTAEEAVFSKSLSETIIRHSGNLICPPRHPGWDFLRLTLVSVLKTGSFGSRTFPA